MSIFAQNPPENYSRYSQTDRAYPTTRPETAPVVNIPGGEVTGLVLLAAVLGVLGNNFMKPLATIILDNFKSDSKATEKLAALLTERVDKLDAERAQYAQTISQLTAQQEAMMRSLQEQTDLSKQYREALTRQGDFLEKMVNSLSVIERCLLAEREGGGGVVSVLPPFPRESLLSKNTQPNQAQDLGSSPAVKEWSLGNG